MHAIAICISTCLLLILSIDATETDHQQPYTPTESFLLSCGSSSTQTHYDDQGRVWKSDSHNQQYFSSQNIQNLSSESTASERGYISYVPKIPYETARIFHSNFTYSFYPVSPGPKFLRFYFYSATYSSLNESDFIFSVTANNFLLLSNFSASLFASTRIPPLPYFVKEFIINVGSNNQNLNVTFNPSPNSHAFINGIEIISMPDNLYITLADKPITFVNSKATPFFFTSDTALENMYRLNVGGRDVINVNDTGLMFRTWIQDWNYIYGYKVSSFFSVINVTIQYNDNTPAYTAPEVVYYTFRQMFWTSLDNTEYNLTWQFPVDTGFFYLVRLHFCETDEEITLQNQRVFFIYINSMVAEEQMDVILFSGGSKIPTYRDYIVFVEKESPGYLMLELYPNVRWKPMYYGAILNGVEIFKLNNFDGNLAGPNPRPPDSVTVSKPKLPRPKGKTKTPSIFKAIIISIVGFAIGLFLLFLVLSYKRIIISLKKKKEEEEADSSLPSDLCRHFTINEIRAATCDFDEKLVIGVGGFGNVYKGRLAGGDQIHVAVKRLNPKSKQGAREFKTEIEMLSHLRHRHLVSLIGYCYENGEMILVYEYMPCGNLSNHLYNTNNPPLSWKQRLKICIGAASGLHYLHGGAKHTIIHRDVKTSNILLDERFVAKVSDFGLSKVGPTSLSKTHVSTMVKGSFGYLDPEYYRRQLLTEKSDVYSFGVVLCEVLCGRPPLLQTIEKKQMNLSEWVRNCHQEKKLHQIVDPYLVGKIAPECLKKFNEIAVSCMLDNGAERPSMKEVLRDLEFAMQLQNNEEENIRLGGEPTEMTEDGTIRIRCGWEDKSGSVFSDIKGLQGR